MELAKEKSERALEHNRDFILKIEAIGHIFSVPPQTDMKYPPAGFFLFLQCSVNFHRRWQQRCLTVFPKEPITEISVSIACLFSTYLLEAKEQKLKAAEQSSEKKTLPYQTSDMFSVSTPAKNA